MESFRCLLGGAKKCVKLKLSKRFMCLNASRNWPTSKPKTESAEKARKWGKNDVEQWIFEVSNSVNIGALILKRPAEFDLRIGDDSGGNAWGFTKNRNDSKFFAGELKILDHRVSSIFVYPSNNKFCEICSI